MGYDEKTARQSAFQFMKTGDPHISMLPVREGDGRAACGIAGREKEPVEVNVKRKGRAAQSKNAPVFFVGRDTCRNYRDGGWCLPFGE